MKSKHFERKIEDDKVEGWKVKEDDDELVVLIKPNYGSFGEHVLIAPCGGLLVSETWPGPPTGTSKAATRRS